MDQDWKPVILRKDQPKAKIPQYVSNIKVDEDGTETVKIKKISHTTSQFIIKARSDKNMKQKDLANMCNLDVSIISNIERGDCIYNATHVNKIGRVLGVKIPR